MDKKEKGNERNENVGIVNVYVYEERCAPEFSAQVND